MMQKYVIEAADLLRKWKKQHEGEQCGHMFYDVLYRGGPKSFEAVSSTAVQCTGRMTVTAVEGRSWEWGDHKELVWRKLHHCRRVRTIRIVRECPVCGQTWQSAVFRQPFEQGEMDRDDEEIPF